MKLWRFRSSAAALHQRGFALIAMLVLAAMITAFLITLGLNRSSAEIANEREDRSMSALRQAKAALIAYAASEEWQAYKGQTTNQPGGLPCPDTGPDTTPLNTGISSGICSSAASRIGRLPFATIGAEDLRDASGERLWYAVSSNFYKTASNTINSDTQGSLIVVGSASASNVVAIVFAPGSPVEDWTLPGQIQDRSTANYNRIASYLEKFTTGGTDYTFNSSALPDQSFNDRLLVITQADLMAAVEPVVAARIARDVSPALTTYSSQWGNAFPFPVLFDTGFGPGTSGSGTNRSSMTYLGDTSQSSGLLPISAVQVASASNASPIMITTEAPHTLSTGSIVWVSGVLGNTAANGKWTITVVDSTHFQLNGSSGNGAYTGDGTVTPSYPWSNWSVSKAGGAGRIDNDTCSPVGASLQCTFQAHDDNCGFFSTCVFNLRFRIQADAGSNVGRTLAVLPDVSTVTTGVVGFPPPFPFSSTSITGLLSNTGVGTVTYSATLPAGLNCNPCSVTYNITVTIPDVVASNVTSASSLVASGWFVANEWYRQTYYSVSPGFLPGGGGSCVTRPSPPTPAGSPSCLLVANLPPLLFPANNDKQAILILGGRTLNGSSRPSPLPNNYLEGANQTALTTIPYAYENRVGSPTSINDRVVVVQ